MKKETKFGTYVETESATKLTGDKITRFVERLKKIGIDVKLSGNFPWVYIDEICGKRVTEKFDGNHGFTLIFLPSRNDSPPSEFTDITEIYYLELDTVAKQLGSIKLAEKLISQIDSSRLATLDQILASFSIPLVGNTASQKISKVVKNINEINIKTCKQAGLGEKVTSNLLNWLETDFVEMKEFLPFSFNSETTIVQNETKTVCITGKLSSFKTKAEAYKILEQNGFIITESVTKATNYLVDEEDRSSTKRKKAEQLGIKIITNLETFLREQIND